jgi:hypothetical protein
MDGNHGGPGHWLLLLVGHDATDGAGGNALRSGVTGRPQERDERDEGTSSQTEPHCGISKALH